MAVDHTQRPIRKATWIALLIPCAILTGLFSGMLIGALFIPADVGLAGGATVLFYGLIGGLVATMVTVVLARQLSAPAIRTVALGALVVFIAVLAPSLPG